MQFSGYVKKYSAPCSCFCCIFTFMLNNLIWFSFYLSCHFLINTHTHTHPHPTTHPLNQVTLLSMSVFILWSFWAVILGYTDTITIWGSRFETRTLDFGPWGLKPSQRLYFDYYYFFYTINQYKWIWQYE